MLHSVALFLFLLHQPPQTPDPRAAGILDAEIALADALVQKDATAFERLLAPDFVLRAAPDVPRERWIENALSLCWGDRYDLDDFTVRATIGDLTVVSLTLTTRRDPVTCEPAIIRSVITDVWRRTDETWQLTLRHSGPAGDALAGQFARIAPPPPRWERAAELSLVSTGGNADTQTLGLGGSLIWRPGPWTTRARVTYVRSTAAGVLTAQALVSELRQSRAITTRLDIFGRTEYVVDRFAGIDFRTGVDAGLGWRVVDANPHTLRLDASSGFSHEERLVGDNLTFAVGNLGAHYRWRFGRTSDVTNQSVLTADLQEAGNWRFTNGIAASANLTRLLSFKLSHELKYANRPVPGFGRTDTILSAALVARW